MSLPHPPDTSAQRLLKAFMEQCESGAWYKLKCSLSLSLFFRGCSCKGATSSQRRSGRISCGWLPSSDLNKWLLSNYWSFTKETKYCFRYLSPCNWLLLPLPLRKQKMKQQHCFIFMLNFWTYFNADWWIVCSSSSFTCNSTGSDVN